MDFKSKIVKFLDYLVHIASCLLKKPLLFLAAKPKVNVNQRFPPIDVLIPIIEKDLPLLNKCVKSLKSYSLNPILNFFIVAPNNARIIEECTQLGLIYVNEESILPISIDELKKAIKDSNKIGWFLQQFLKLNSDKVPEINENYLIFDADTILLSEQYFITSKYTILKYSDEFHFLYRLTNQRILKFFNFHVVSFICHQMVFNKKALIEMKDYIERVNEKGWVEVILEESFKNSYYFSEYELYSQYVLKKYRDRIKIYYWFNKNSNIVKMNSSKVYSEKYQSISFHNYNRI